MARFKVFNGPMPTTVAFAAVATGTSIKTMLQLKATNFYKINAWGISFDGSAAAQPVVVSLGETGSVFATVTAFVDNDIIKLDGADQAAGSVNGITFTATGSGYTSTSEGAITIQRPFDIQEVAPTNQYIYQFPLGQEPKCVIGNSMRIMVKAAGTVNAICWVEIEI